MYFPALYIHYKFFVQIYISCCIHRTFNKTNSNNKMVRTLMKALSPYVKFKAFVTREIRIHYSRTFTVLWIRSVTVENNE